MVTAGAKHKDIAAELPEMTFGSETDKMEW